MVWNGQTRRKNCHPFHKGKKLKKNTHTHTHTRTHAFQFGVLGRRVVYFLLCFDEGETWSSNNRSVWNAISWFGRRLGPAWHICPRSPARLPGSGINLHVQWNYNANAVFFLGNCWFRSFEAHLFAGYLDASFRSLPWGKWRFVELFELPVANMSNIKSNLSWYQKSMLWCVL